MSTIRLIDRDLPITALLCSDGPALEAFLARAAERLSAEGLRLAGLIQESRPREARRRCDIHLRDLATGTVHGVSEDRGPEARGCMLDTDRLLRAGAAAERGLSAETDLLIVNKFGKTEAAGGGLRPLIAQALTLAVPVLVGVPHANLAAFRTFAGGLAREIELTDAERAAFPLSEVQAAR
jgi:nucleoside-triphosphatase THEP1